MSAEQKALVEKSLQLSPSWNRSDIEIDSVDTSESPNATCRGDRKIGVQVINIEYKDQDQLWSEDVFPPDQALILIDRDFRKIGIDQAVLLEGHYEQQLVLDEFIDLACTLAKCNGGADCLKKRINKK